MEMKVRALLSSVVVLTMTSLVGCGHYICSEGAQFGNSTCTSSGSTSLSGGGGGTTSAASAFAFAVDEVGTMDGYTLTSGGTSPSFGPTASYTAPTIPSGLEGSGMVVAQSQYLYSDFEGTGQIYGWTVGSGGGLTAISGSPFSAGYLIGSPSGGLWSMITNPAGTLLFVLNTSGMSVEVYQIGSGGALTQVSGSPFSVPFFPGNLGVDGQGKYLYVTGYPNSSEVAAYTIGTSGALTAVSGSPFAYPMGQVQGDPSGKYLIGIQSSNFGVSDIYVFSIAQSGTNAGAIAPVAGSPFATNYLPYSIAVQPSTNGTLIYSFSINATSTGYNPIEGYALNTSNGALSALSGSPFSGISNGFWGQFDQSGQFLFVFGDVSNGTSNTAYLGALSVGSGGLLTQPTTQLDLATLGFWTVTDPK